MLRTIIKIDADKCIGCEKCVRACHEGAITMVEGKATLLRDDYCDGLGNCLPVCPTDAISFEEREAVAFDEAATKANMEKATAQILPTKNLGKFESTGEIKNLNNIKQENLTTNTPFSCAGKKSETIERANTQSSNFSTENIFGHKPTSQLQQWPLQIKLVPINAPYFENAKLLIAADCTAFAYGDFHNQFMRGKITLIGCPKLDEGTYTEKLTAIIKNNNIKDLTIVRMQVPCCAGLENAVKEALQASEKFIPWQIVQISTDGRILD